MWTQAATVKLWFMCIQAFFFLFLIISYWSTVLCWLWPNILRLYQDWSVVWAITYKYTKLLNIDFNSGYNADKLTQYWYSFGHVLSSKGTYYFKSVGGWKPREYQFWFQFTNASSVSKESSISPRLHVNTSGFYISSTLGVYSVGVKKPEERRRCPSRVAVEH